MSRWRSFCRALVPPVLPYIKKWILLSCRTDDLLCSARITLCDGKSSSISSMLFVVHTFLWLCCGCADPRSSTTATVQPDWTVDSQSCMIKTFDWHFPGSVVYIITVL